MNIQTAIKRLRAHKNNYCAEKFVKGASIHEALDMAITALEQKAKREEIIRHLGKEIDPNIMRYATIVTGEYKGKYGTEHIATIRYDVQKTHLYSDNKLKAPIYPWVVKCVKASSHKRLIKKG